MADDRSPHSLRSPGDYTFETFVDLLTRLLGETQGGKVHVSLAFDDPAAVPLEAAAEAVAGSVAELAAESAAEPAAELATGDSRPSPQAAPPSAAISPTAAPPLPYHRPPTVTAVDYNRGSPARSGAIGSGAPRVTPTSSHSPSLTSLNQALHQWQGSIQHLEAQRYDPDRLLRLLLPAVAETLRHHIHDRRSSLAHLLTAEVDLSVEERLYQEEEALLEALRPTLHSALGEYFAETLRLLNQSLHPDGNSPPSAPGLLGAWHRSHPASPSADPPFQPHTTLLLHSKSGLLLAHATHPDQPPLHSGSLTPILMTLRSTLASPQTQAGMCHTLHQNHWHLVLLPGDLAALALVSQGPPPPYFTQQMQVTLNGLLSRYGTTLQGFAGDPHTLPTTLGQKLFELVQTQEPVPAKRWGRLGQLVGLGAAALLLGGGVAIGLGLQRQRLEAEAQAQQQAQRAAEAQVQGQRAEIDRLQQTVNQWAGVQLEVSPGGEGVVLRGWVSRAVDRENIGQLFAQIPEIGSVTNQIKVKSPEITTQIYFYGNSATVTPRDISTKLLAVKQTLEQFPSIQVQILGYAAVTEPLSLAQERAEAVQNILADQGIDRRRLLIAAQSDFPPGVTADQDDWLSRCVVFEVLP